MELIFKHRCGKCEGSGIEPIGGVPPHPPERQCIACDGEGELYWGHADALIAEFDEMDSKLLSIEEKIDALIESVDYIYGKVTAIWNQVKPGE